MNTPSPQDIGMSAGNQILKSIEKIKSGLDSSMKPGPRTIYGERIEKELKDLLYLLTLVIVENKLGCNQVTDSINISCLEFIYGNKGSEETDYALPSGGYSRAIMNGDFNLKALALKFNQNLFDQRKEKYFEMALLTELLIDFIGDMQGLVKKSAR